MSNRYSLLLSAIKQPNYGVLLTVLCLLVVLAPVATGAGSVFGVEILFDLVLVAGAYWLAAQHALRWPFLAFTALTFALRWSALLIGGFWLELASATTTVLWVALSITITVSDLFQRRKVTFNSIMGAIVGYLLVAVAFAHLYEILELFQPGSFSGIPEAASPAQLGDALIYFSLVSLTTVGYGDIVPVSDVARPVAALEAAFGTLYVAVMIARLVALHVISGDQKREE